MKFGNKKPKSLKITIDKNTMNNILLNFKTVYGRLEKYIQEEINDFDSTRWCEDYTLVEVSNSGLFTPFYEVSFLRGTNEYVDIEEKLIRAMNRFMYEHGYKIYFHDDNCYQQEPYYFNHGILSDKDDNTAIILHIEELCATIRISITIFRNDIAKNNKFNNNITEKENKYMCFDEAYTKMLEGNKITRPCFKGYWYINGVTGKPTIHLANGEEITSGDLSITLPNVLAKDWIVLE